MTTKPTLTGHGLTLRDFLPGDVTDRLALGQTPEIIRMYGADLSRVGRLGEAAVKDWIGCLAKHPFACAIEHVGKWIGEIRLDALDEHDRRAKLAIGLYDAELLGRGLGRQAITLLMAHAFTVMTLHRVSLRVLAYNARAIRCYSACGFVEEGREREAAFVCGEWHDDVMMGLLAREFLAR
ncbi:MAG: GNAT family protein [Azospirillaceae bacterium]|nr:GNAT family protein [Azospirillaceae bacterium]